MAVEESIPKFGTVRSVGGESIVAQRVAFSRDSKIAFCCCGRRIRVYSTATGDLLRDLKGHEKNVTDVKVNPRNHLQLVSCSLDGVVVVWDYTDSSILQKYRFQSCFVGLLLHHAHEGFIFLITGHKPNNKRKYKGKRQAHAEKLVAFNTKEWKEGDEILDILLKRCGNAKKCALSSKGDLLVSVKKDCLYLWDFNSKSLKWFTYSDAIFTCAAFHPFEPCVAAGDKKGRIILWQGLNQLEDPVTMVLHWHSHPVGDITFTNDGSSILSGGEESVFVLWQYKTDHRQFLPRLGAHITHITVSSDDSLIAVCQKDNVIRLISNIEWKIKCTIQGLRQNSPSSSSSVGIFDPRSRALVLNSMPGILQFYMPQDDRHAFSLDVVKQNYVTKTENEKLYFADVTQAAFNDDGSWLATVERKDDKRNAVEMQLKFWEYNKIIQSYGLNTCVDKSNSSSIVAIQFQPQKCEKTNISLLMTAGTDGKFEIWILAEEELVKDKKYSWTCRSVGYYGDMPCQDAAFSEDGSVLAIAYSQAITLWTPDTNELKKSLSLPYPEEEIKSIKFGNHASSQYLISTTKSHLTVWNLLSCSVSWSVQTHVSRLLADPQTNLIHVFSLFSESKCHLYVFDPASPCPVAVQSKILKSPVMMAAFDPGSSPSSIKDGTKFKMSTLYFMNKDQELFTLDCGGTHVEEKSTSGSQDLLDDASEQESDFFFKMFGSSVMSKGESSVRHVARTVIGTPSSVVVRQMLSTPSHVLPSVSSLCSTFLLSLMVSKQPAQRENEPDEDDNDSDKQDEIMEVEEDSEPETVPVAETPSAEMTDSVVSQRDNRNFEEHVDLESVNFEWLQDYFTSS